MKISRDWLNNYIVSNKTDDELVDAFTDLGLECASKKNNSIDVNIVVGEVVSCIKHPNADRLKICEVDVCDDELLTVVCGAPNVRKNILVPIAKVGSNLGDFKIKKTKIRDVVSNGMICSEKELGISDEHEGIMILDENLQKGEALDIALSIKDDSIFDFDITPNRGDCFSHLGIARELSIIESKKIKKENIEFKRHDFDTADLIKVNIKDNNLCSRYACRIVKNIKVKESPQWLKKRLSSIGQKSINNVVDLSNFIMFDLGQPLHIFDYDKLNGKKIEVRLAKKNEKILCLNNELKKLSDDDIVIADSKGPVAIAGIIGGFDSQVDNDTTNILLESAVFNEINIRKTSKKYEYDKEASKRFERGVDYDNIIYVMEKFTKLLIDISGGEASNDFIDIKANINNLRKIKFNFKNCNNFLGIDLSISEYKKIFSKLFIHIETEKNNFICTVPSYRNDLYREVDLYEEVARVYGYDKIPSLQSCTIPYSVLIKDELGLENKIRQFLSSNAFNEHYSNSLISKSDTDFFSNTVPVKLANPLSKDMKYLRNSIFPGILKALSYNERRKQENLKIYEIGSIQHYETKKKKTDVIVEDRFLGIAWLGSTLKYWQGNIKQDFFKVKGEVLELLKFCGIKNVSFIESQANFSNMNVEIIIDNKNVGNISELNTKIKSNYSLISQVFIAGINLNLVKKINNNKNKYLKPSQYPLINRDVSILIDNIIKNKDIEENIYKNAGELLIDLKLFDLYQGSDLPENKVSLTYSLKFQSISRTLKDKEIDVLVNKIVLSLKKKFKAIQR